MPLDTKAIKGKYSELLVSDAQDAPAIEPADVTLTVGAGGAIAGATSVPMTSSVDVTLRKNQILIFNEGDPDEVALIVTADTPVTSVEGPVPVDAVEGEEGDGIPGALAAADTATWDQLYRLLGTQDSPYALAPTTQQLQNVTYDTADAMSWDEEEISSNKFNIDRSGRFKVDDHAWKQIDIAAHDGKEVWVKQIRPREDGSPALIREGRAKITGYNEPAPADGLVDASWTFSGQGKPKRTEVAAA